MSDLTDDQADALESAHACFAREDGVARAAPCGIGGGCPAGPSPTWKIGVRTHETVRLSGRNCGRLAPDAGRRLALNEAKPLFAQVAKAMSRAKGFRCDLIEISPGYAGAENAQLAGHVFWTASGEERLEWLKKYQQPECTLIHRPGYTGLLLEPATKRYRIVPKSSAREFSFGLFRPPRRI